ncbi:hypothetical protein LH462_00085 [Laribacter hongkongensis]|uniref:DUF7168 domain-containing protein n=1 Tax=Laribacter hongkongensis TaxID=168471 RepID=A0ABD4SLX5_9NEIS|nr:hypothetical protein [Laribacter hongkongensis]MCG9024726.1 hypothetical protein [Laribacter hongkongensis]MCG9100763.1 hypothetical protein [Laribacter hongkongensis]MCG9102137.1 hypothetical protein [Laribacter hongkongensis]MCG9112171.1 hypothetical protein [Laribacter hongkongensis]MCG9118785.1 hypothetical protein [Laribacter hongkongensis]
MNRPLILEHFEKSLSRCANEDEAVAALLDAQSVAAPSGAGDILEIRAKAGAKSVPVVWESELAATCAAAFAARVLFATTAEGGFWCFVGTKGTVGWAMHAFVGLMRLLKRERSRFVAQTCDADLPNAAKTRRADMFCRTWVGMLKSRLPVMTVCGDVQAYLQEHYPALDTLAARDRNDLTLSARRKSRATTDEGTPAPAETPPDGVPPLLVWEV